MGTFLLLAAAASAAIATASPWRPGGRLEKGYRDSFGQIADNTDHLMVNGRNLAGTAEHSTVDPVNNYRHSSRSRWQGRIAEEFVSVDRTESIIAMECDDAEIRVLATMPPPEGEEFPSLHPAYWTEDTVLAGDGRWGCASTRAIYGFVKENSQSSTVDLSTATAEQDEGKRSSSGAADPLPLDLDKKAFRAAHADLHLPFYREITRVVGQEQEQEGQKTQPPGFAVFVFRTADAALSQLFDSLNFQVDTTDFSRLRHEGEHEHELEGEGEEALVDPEHRARRLAFLKEFPFGSISTAFSGIGLGASISAFSVSAKCDTCTIGFRDISLSIFGDLGIETSIFPPKLSPYFNYVGAKMIAYPQATLLASITVTVSKDASGTKVWKGTEYKKNLNTIKIGNNVVMAGPVPILFSYYGFFAIKGKVGAEASGCLGNLGVSSITGGIGGRLEVNAKKGLVVDRYTPNINWAKPDPLKLEGKIEFSFGVQLGLQTRIYETMRFNVAVAPFASVAIVANEEVYADCGKGFIRIEPSAGVNLDLEVEDPKFEFGPVEINFDVPGLPISRSIPLLGPFPLPKFCYRLLTFTQPTSKVVFKKGIGALLKIPMPNKNAGRRPPNRGSATPNNGKCRKADPKKCPKPPSPTKTAGERQKAAAAAKAASIAAEKKKNPTSFLYDSNMKQKLLGTTGSSKPRGTTSGAPKKADPTGKSTSKVVAKGHTGGKPAPPKGGSSGSSNTGPGAHRGGAPPAPPRRADPPAPPPRRPDPPKPNPPPSSGGAKGGSKRKLSDHLPFLPSSSSSSASSSASSIDSHNDETIAHEHFVPPSFDEMSELPHDWETAFEDHAVAIGHVSTVVEDLSSNERAWSFNPSNGGQRRRRLQDEGDGDGSEDDDYDDEEDDGFGANLAEVSSLVGSFEQQELAQYLDALTYVEEKTPEEIAAAAAAAEALDLAKRAEINQAITDRNTTICAQNFTCVWTATPWSTPDTVCGPGMVTRDLACVHVETATVLPSYFCEIEVDERPAATTFSPTWSLCGSWAEYATLSDCQAGNPGAAVAFASTTVPWTSSALDGAGKPVRSAYFKCEGSATQNSPFIRCYGSGCPATILTGQDKACVGSNAYSLVGRTNSFYRFDCQQPGASDTVFMPMASNTFHRALVRPAPPAANSGTPASTFGITHFSRWAVTVPSTIGVDTLTVLVNVQHNFYGRVPVNVTASFSSAALQNYIYTDTGVTAMVPIGPFATAAVWEARPLDMPYESRVAGAYFPLTSVFRIRVGSTSPGYFAGATLLVQAAFDFDTYGTGNESLVEVSVFPSTSLGDASAVTRVVTLPPAWQSANASSPDALAQPLNEPGNGDFKPASPQGMFYNYRRPADADGAVFVAEALDADAVALGFRYALLARCVLAEHASTWPFFGQSTRADTYAGSPVWWLKQGQSQVTTATTKAVALNEAQFLPCAEFTVSLLPLGMPTTTPPSGFTRTTVSTAVSVRVVPIKRLTGLITANVRLSLGTQQGFVISAPEKASRLVVRVVLSAGLDPTGLLQLHGALGAYSTNIVVSSSSPEADGSYSLTFQPGGASWASEFTFFVYALGDVDGQMTVSTYEDLDPIFPVQRRLAPMESHVFLARRASFFPVNPVAATAADFANATNTGGAASPAAAIAGSAASIEALRVAAALRRDFAVVVENEDSKSPGSVSVFTGSADYFYPAPQQGSSGPSILEIAPGEAAMLYRPFTPTDQFLPDVAVTVTAAFSSVVKSKENLTQGFDPDTVGAASVYRLSAAANAAAKDSGARILRTAGTEGHEGTTTTTADAAAAVAADGEQRALSSSAASSASSSSLTPAEMGIVGFGTRSARSHPLAAALASRRSASSLAGGRGRRLQFTTDTASWQYASPRDSANVGGFVGASTNLTASGGSASSSSSSNPFALSPGVLNMQRQQLKFVSMRQYDSDSAAYITSAVSVCDSASSSAAPACCSLAGLAAASGPSPPLGICSRLKAPTSEITRTHTAVISVPPETAVIITVTSADAGVRLVVAGLFDRPANPSELPAVKAATRFAFSVVNPSLTRSRLFFLVIEPSSPLVTVTTPVVAVRVDSSTPIPAQYEWRTTEFSACDAVCGASKQTRSVFCAEADTGRAVDDSECAALGLAKPVAWKTCNVGACVAVASYWSDCSAACSGGIAYRNLECRNGEGSGRVVPDVYCPELPSVPRQIACNTDACNTTMYRWNAGPWGPCTDACGGGVRTRKVSCVDTRGFTVPIGRCFRTLDQVPPMAQDICNTEPCADTPTVLRVADVYRLTGPTPFAQPGSKVPNATMSVGIVDVTIPAEGAAGFRVDKPSMALDGVCIAAEALGSVPTCSQDRLHQLASDVQSQLSRCLSDVSAMFNLTELAPKQLLTLSQPGATMSAALLAQVTSLSGGSSKTARKGFGFQPTDLLATLILPSPFEVAAAVVSCHANASAAAFEAASVCGGMPPKLVGPVSPSSSSSSSSSSGYVAAEWPTDGVSVARGDNAGLMGDAVGYFSSLSSTFKAQCVARISGIDVSIVASTACSAGIDMAVSATSTRLLAIANSPLYRARASNLTLAIFASAFRNTAPVPLTVPYSPQTSHFLAIQSNNVRAKAALGPVNTLFLRIQPVSASAASAAAAASSSSFSAPLPSEGTASTAGLSRGFDGAVFSLVNGGTMGQVVRVSASWFTGSPATVTGTLTGLRSDAQIRSGGLTLTVRLLCDNFLPSVVAEVDSDSKGPFNGTAAAMVLDRGAYVAGLRATETAAAMGTSAGAETGWNLLALPALAAALRAGSGGASISFSADMKAMTLTLPPLPAYFPSGEERLTLTLPGILLSSGHDLVIADPFVTISAANSDCLVSAWSDWSDCPASCRDVTDTSKAATTTRSRTVLSEPRGTGAVCPALSESKECADPCSPCDRITCGNAGTCVAGLCVCPPGFTGHLCQNPPAAALVSSSSASSSSSSSLAGSASSSSSSNSTAVAWRTGMWLPCVSQSSGTGGAAPVMTSVEKTTRQVSCVPVSCLLLISRKINKQQRSTITKSDGSVVLASPSASPLATAALAQQIAAACAPLSDATCLAANLTKPVDSKACGLANRTRLHGAMTSKKEQVLSVQVRLQSSLATALQMHSESAEAAQQSFLTGLSRALGLPVEFLSLGHSARAAAALDAATNANATLPLQIEIRIPEALANDPSTNSSAILVRLANTLSLSRAASKLRGQAAQALRAAALAVAANTTASSSNGGRRLQSGGGDPALAPLLDIDPDSEASYQISTIAVDPLSTGGSGAVAVPAQEASGAGGNPTSLLQKATVVISSVVGGDTAAPSSAPPSSSSPSSVLAPGSPALGALIGVAVIIAALVAVLGALVVHNRRQRQMQQQHQARTGQLLPVSSPSGGSNNNGASRGAGPGILPSSSRGSFNVSVNPAAISPVARRQQAAAAAASRPSFGLLSGGDGRHKSRNKFAAQTLALSSAASSATAPSSSSSSLSPTRRSMSPGAGVART